MLWRITYFVNQLTPWGRINVYNLKLPRCLRNSPYLWNSSLLCSQVFTSILRLNQMNASHILTAISLHSAVFKGPMIVLVAVPNVEWPNVDCSYTYQQTSCNTDCCDIPERTM